MKFPFYLNILIKKAFNYKHNWKIILVIIIINKI